MFSHISAAKTRHLLSPALLPQAILTALLCAATTTAVVVIYPSPGDLSQCDNLRQSTRYQVLVNSQSAFVYESRNTKQPDSKIMEAHFCCFSFKDEPVTIQITNLGGNISRVAVSPLRLNVPTTISGNTVTFSMQTPQKYYIKINDLPYPLAIFADTPDESVPSGSQVRRFGPGYHNIGRDAYIMESNKEIYIEGGAVVEGTLKSTGQLANFKLRGRGIVYAGDYPWTHDGAPWNMGIFYTSRLSNSLIEGIILLDSPYWNLGIENIATEFNNIKIIGWHHNTDGIWVGPGSRVKDCFIINNDDSVRPLSTVGYADNTSTVIDGVVIYNMAWGAPFKILANPVSWCPHPIQNMIFRNVDIIHSEAWGSGDGGFLFIGQGSETPKVEIKNLVFENINVESFTRNLFNVKTWPTSAIRNLTFRNITTATISGVFEGLSQSEPIDGILFENLKVGDRMITSWEQTGMTKNEFVYNVAFRVTATRADHVRLGGAHISSRGGAAASSRGYDIRGRRIRAGKLLNVGTGLVAVFGSPPPPKPMQQHEQRVKTSGKIIGRGID